MTVDDPRRKTAGVVVGRGYLLLEEFVRVARYRRLYVRTWVDDKFRLLTPILPCGQGLWVWLLTGPATIHIPGIVTGTPAVLAAQLNWPREDFERCLDEILGLEMAIINRDDGILWIPNGPSYNPPESPNVVRSWSKTWPEIPDSPLKAHIYQHLKAFCEGLGEAFGKAFGEAIRKPSSNQEQLQLQFSGAGAERTPPLSPPPGGETLTVQNPETEPTGASAPGPPREVVEALFNEYVWDYYPPRRRGPFDRALAEFRKLVLGLNRTQLETFAKRIQLQIWDDEKSNPDWKSGTFINRLDRYMQSRPWEEQAEKPAPAKKPAPEPEEPPPPRQPKTIEELAAHNQRLRDAATAALAEMNRVRGGGDDGTPEPGSEDSDDDRKGSSDPDAEAPGEEGPPVPGETSEQLVPDSDRECPPGDGGRSDGEDDQDGDRPGSGGTGTGSDEGASR